MTSNAQTLSVLFEFFTSSVVLGSPISDMEAQLLGDSQFQFEYRVESLPEGIRKVLYAAAGTQDVSNYGETYNKTDAINPKYPMV